MLIIQLFQVGKTIRKFLVITFKQNENISMQLHLIIDEAIELEFFRTYKFIHDQNVCLMMLFVMENLHINIIKSRLLLYKKKLIEIILLHFVDA
jgi:hypothetical protein